ncbi:hypothetical protein ACFL1T_04340, partial [Chlamydiota bacterium]
MLVSIYTKVYTKCIATFVILTLFSFQLAGAYTGNPFGSPQTKQEQLFPVSPEGEGQADPEGKDQYLNQQQAELQLQKEKYQRSQFQQENMLRRQAHQVNKQQTQDIKQLGKEISEAHRMAEFQKMRNFIKNINEAMQIANQIARLGLYYIRDKNGITTRWYFNALPYAIIGEVIHDTLGNRSIKNTYQMEYNDDRELIGYSWDKYNAWNVRVEAGTFWDGEYYDEEDEALNPRHKNEELKSFNQQVIDDRGVYRTTERSNIEYYTEEDEAANEYHVEDQVSQYDDIVKSSDNWITEVHFRDAEYLKEEKDYTDTDPYDDEEKDRFESMDPEDREDAKYDNLLISYSQITLMEEVETHVEWRGEYDELNELLIETHEEGYNNLGETYRVDTVNMAYHQTGILMYFDQTREDYDGITRTMTSVSRRPEYDRYGILVGLLESVLTSGSDPTGASFDGTGIREYVIMRGLERLVRDWTEYNYYNEDLYTTDTTGALVLIPSQSVRTVTTESFYEYNEETILIDAWGTRDTLVTDIVRDELRIIEEGHATLEYAIFYGVARLVHVHEETTHYNLPYYTTDLDTGELYLDENPMIRQVSSDTWYEYESTIEELRLVNVYGASDILLIDIIKGVQSIIGEGHSYSEYEIRYGRSYLVHTQEVMNYSSGLVYTTNLETGELELVSDTSQRQVITDTYYTYSLGKLTSAVGKTSTLVQQMVDGSLQVVARGTATHEYQIFYGKAKIVRTVERMDYGEELVYHENEDGELVLVRNITKKVVNRIIEYSYDQLGRLFDAEEDFWTEIRKLYGGELLLIGEGVGYSDYIMYMGRALVSATLDQLLFDYGILYQDHPLYPNNPLYNETLTYVSYNYDLWGALMSATGYSTSEYTTNDYLGNFVSFTTVNSTDVYIILRGQARIFHRETETNTNNFDDTEAWSWLETDYTYDEDGLLMAVEGLGQNTSNSLGYKDDDDWEIVQLSETSGEVDQVYILLMGTGYLRESRTESATINIDGTAVLGSESVVTYDYDEAGRLYQMLGESWSLSESLGYTYDEALGDIVLTVTATTETTATQYYKMNYGEGKVSKAVSHSETEVPTGPCSHGIIEAENISDSTTLYGYNDLGDLIEASGTGFSFSNDGWDNVTSTEQTILYAILFGSAKAIETMSISETLNFDESTNHGESVTTNQYDVGDVGLGDTIHPYTGTIVMNNNAFLTGAESITESISYDGLGNRTETISVPDYKLYYGKVSQIRQVSHSHTYNYDESEATSDMVTVYINDEFGRVMYADGSGTTWSNAVGYETDPILDPNATIIVISETWGTVEQTQTIRYGNIKVIQSDSTSTSQNLDGSEAHSDMQTTYTFDRWGHLESAHGEGTSWSNTIGYVYIDSEGTGTVGPAVISETETTIDQTYTIIHNLAKLESSHNHSLSVTGSYDSAGDVTYTIGLSESDIITTYIYNNIARLIGAHGSGLSLSFSKGYLTELDVEPTFINT